MGIQEREMQAERGGAKITSDGLAILTAARIIKRVLEKFCIEAEYELKLTLHQANAIIDMDNHGYSESLGPKDEGACGGWGELLVLAEIVTGRTADANL